MAPNVLQSLRIFIYVVIAGDNDLMTGNMFSTSTSFIRRKGFVSALLCGVTVALGCGMGFAQTPQAALAAEMAVPFGSAPGTVVLHDDYVLFADTEQPAGSFAIRRADMVGVTNNGGVVVVRTSRPFRMRTGESSQWNIKFTAPESAGAFEQWFRSSNGMRSSEAGMTPAAASSTSSANNSGGTTAGAFLSYDVTSKRFLGRDGRGKLFFTSDKIVFEAINDLERSRQWEWRDIKEMKRGNPYQLKLIPFTGDSYDFVLVGTPMDNSQYKDIVDRVTKARLGTK
jgi:hypothetical protein